jgi:hypothetical protein
MNTSISTYRLLSRFYPASFRSRYGASVDQAFRDLLRDASQRRGFVGVLFLWFHVIADFIFAIGELLLRTAGDFLKWRLRLQWVVACTLGFILTALVNAIFRDSIRALGPLASAAISTTILIASVGIFQSRVLDRCFRRIQWVIYGIVGAVLPTLLVVPLLIRANSLGVQAYLIQWLDFSREYSEILYWFLQNLVFSAPLVILGAAIGLAQSAAIRGNALTARRWIVACAAGYVLSQALGETAAVFTSGNVGLQLFVRSLTKGVVLGLITARTLEEIVLSVQAAPTRGSRR